MDQIQSPRRIVITIDHWWWGLLCLIAGQIGLVVSWCVLSVIQIIQRHPITYNYISSLNESLVTGVISAFILCFIEWYTLRKFYPKPWFILLTNLIIIPAISVHNFVINIMPPPFSRRFQLAAWLLIYMSVFCIIQIIILRKRGQPTIKWAIYGTIGYYLSEIVSVSIGIISEYLRGPV